MEGAARAPGPRLPGRLTHELILRSPQYMSCIGYYELDLRGNKIGGIENLGATQNQFDSIDLSDNAIVRVDGFPKLARLKMLLLNNNRITKIARGLEAMVANLETLVLANNRINELKDLDPLASLPKLHTLSLVGNPVATNKDYRLYAISRLPKLDVLDFKKVKQKERDAAVKMYGADAAAAAAAGQTADEEAAPSGKTFEPGEDIPMEAPADSDAAEAATPAQAAGAPTAEQLTAIKAAIANAQTLEEVRALEQALREGHVPSQFQFKGGAENGAGAAAMDED